MTPNSPKNIQEPTSQPNRDVERPEERPNPEKVSPSQHGKFLSALDEKGKKKTQASKTSTKPTSEDEDIFQLSSIRGPGKKKPLSDALESDVGEETFSEEGFDNLAQKQKQPSPVSKEQVFIASQMAAGSELGKTTAQTNQSAQQPSQVVPPKHMQNITPNIKEKSGKPEEASTTSFKQKLSSTDSQQKREPTNIGAQGPLGYVQEIAENAQIQEKEFIEQAQAERTALFRIVQETIHAIEVLKTKLESTITVYIKNPPAFAGAVMKVVESASAKNEFNITFENLSPQARQMIELQANQLQLRNELLVKGYTLRNVVIAPDVHFGPTITPTAQSSTFEDRRSKEERGNEGFEQGRNPQDTSR
jgi:hypothetical protein